MAKGKANLALAQLAEEFTASAETYKNRQERHEYLDLLNHRVTQLTTIQEDVQKLGSYSRRLRNKGIHHSIPKQKLAGRITNLKKLIEKFEKSPDVIVQPNVIDTEAYNHSFKEIDEKLRAEWRKFALYDKRADSYARVIHEDDFYSKIVDKINQDIAELRSKIRDLPSTENDIDQVNRIKNGIVKSCDQLEADGIDEEVSKFLFDTKDIGFSLKKLLQNRKILDWLSKKNRANAFIVKKNS